MLAFELQLGQCFCFKDKPNELLEVIEKQKEKIKARVYYRMSDIRHVPLDQTVIPLEKQTVKAPVFVLPDHLG